jgi:hypothetical protein
MQNSTLQEVVDFCKKYLITNKEAFAHKKLYLVINDAKYAYFLLFFTCYFSFCLLNISKYLILLVLNKYLLFKLKFKHKFCIVGRN